MNAGNAEKLKRIKLLILDVDGVLTDGRLWWVGEGWTRAFDVKDGFGIRLLLRSGVEVAWLSGADAPAIRERAASLGVTRLYLGDEDKLTVLDKVVRETGFQLSEIAFMGDELFDIPVLKVVGFSATVSDAVDEVKEIVDYVTVRAGGRGAVREVIDMIRKSLGLNYK